jgi:hypothetical protein
MKKSCNDQKLISQPSSETQAYSRLSLPISRLNQIDYIVGLIGNSVDLGQKKESFETNTAVKMKLE